MQSELALHRAAGEHELVHAQLAVGERQVLRDAGLPQPREQVVGVQHRRLGGVPQPVGAERADVGVGAHEAAVVALEAAQAPDRLRARAVALCTAAVVEVEHGLRWTGRRSVSWATAPTRPRSPRPPRIVLHRRHHSRARRWPHSEHRSRRPARTTIGTRQERRDPLGHRDRTRPRAAAAVGLGEGLVQVEVDDVEAHVARPREPHHRVEVGAVVVERRADPVHDLGDLVDVVVEQAERVRVGQHQAGDVGVGLRAQVVEVDAAVERWSRA